MDKQNAQEGEGEVSVEASGDAIILAEGLHAIASAIREVAKAMAGDEVEDSGVEYYLDGSRK